MPDILTTTAQYDHLPEDTLGVDGLHRIVDRAERTVIDRYRGRSPRSSTDAFDVIGGERAPVQLDGWKETNDGAPDVDAMSDDLVHALRDSIARLVEHRVHATDRNVALEVRGSRTKSYRGRGVPHRVYAPLRPFDDRTPWM